jgi:general stress protein 26
MDNPPGEKGDPRQEVAEQAIGSLEDLRAILAELDTAMLVTAAQDGTLHARPMAIQDPRALPDADLWFVTADDTPKVDEIERDAQVNVCTFREKDRTFLSISATARVMRDPALVQKLWRPDWRLWFGSSEPTDGRIVILKLRIHHAESWRPEGGRLVTLYSPAKAADEDADDAEKGWNRPKRIG